MEIKKRSKFNPIKTDYDEFRTMIMNEIETRGFYKLKNISNYLNNSQIKEFQNDEKFLKFIVSLFGKPKSLHDISILSFYLSQLDGVIEIIKHSNENIIQLLQELANEFEYEFHLANKLIIKKGKKVD